MMEVQVSRRTKKGSADRSGLDAPLGGAPSSGGGSSALGGTSGGSLGTIAPVDPVRYDSGYGWTFMYRGSTPVNAYRPLMLIEMFQFYSRGYWARNSGALLADEPMTQVESFWDNLYEMIVHMGEMRDGYKHSPQTLTDPEIIRHYVDHWVSSVINVRSLYALLNSLQYNAATVSTMTALRGIRSRSDYYHRVLSSMPMPDLFRQFAVLHSTPVVPVPGGPALVKFCSHKSLNFGTNNATDWGNSYNCIDLTSATEVGYMLDDIERSILEITSQGSDADDNEDYRNLMALLHMLNFPTGLPPYGALSVSRKMWDEQFRKAFVGIDTQGVGNNEMVIYPEVDEQDDLIHERGMGAPDIYDYSGFGRMYAMSPKDPKEEGVTDEYVMYGALFPFRPVNSVHLSPVRRHYTIGGGWADITNEIDVSTVNVHTWLADYPIFQQHQWVNRWSAIEGTIAFRGPYDIVDWEFHQPHYTKGEIYRVMLSNAWGVPIQR
jgi:hypothetical protein